MRCDWGRDIGAEVGFGRTSGEPTFAQTVGKSCGCAFTFLQQCARHRLVILDNVDKIDNVEGMLLPQ